MNIRFIVSAVLEVLGILVIAVGAGLVYVPAGVILGGLGLAVVGYCIDPPRKVKESREPAF